MKKLIFIILGSILLFVLLVGLVFGVLTFMEQSDKNDVVQIDNVPTEENNSILGILLADKQTIIDSLSAIVTMFGDSVTNLTSESDSINILLVEKTTRIFNDSTKIVKLERDIAKIKNDQIESDLATAQTNEDVKQLAKTYEQMKVTEMKAIFSKLDDKTIIALYTNMSARKRPAVLKALSTDRAAKITKELAQ